MAADTLLRWPTWIGIVVDDLEGQRRFWAGLLGVPEDHSGPDFVDFELGEGRSFELIRRSDDPEYDRLRFQVGFEVDSIEAVHQELVRLGVESIGGIVEDDAGAPWAYFRDPEGNVFEIKQRLAEIRRRPRGSSPSTA
jgi:catechol 2,3-dioxygenase-like lactoylglutathione lyase family enzyme